MRAANPFDEVGLSLILRGELEQLVVALCLGARCASILARIALSRISVICFSHMKRLLLDRPIRWAACGGFRAVRKKLTGGLTHDQRS
jgi:hypothetical protein